ncbi:MAG TPA: hypothetical protein PLW14_00905 [Chlorobiota bacterium]|nr:hypothetical protein [Chlorobiota bacterium]
MTVGTAAHNIRQTLFVIVALVVTVGAAFGQDNVGIGTATPDPSALLDLTSTSKGLLTPRMTTAQRDAIVLPATGLLVYNTSEGSYQYNFGTPSAPQWVTLLFIGTNGGNANRYFWSLFGNDTVDANINFLGTRVPVPLVVKTDNITRLTVAATGEVSTEKMLTVKTEGLNLGGTTTPLLFDLAPGAAGQLPISSGPGATPRWYTGITATDTMLRITAPSRFTELSIFDLLPRLPLVYGHILVGDSSDVAVPLSPGTNESLLLIRNGRPTWVRQEEASYWSLSGNAGIPASAYLGTTDANDLRLATNGQLRLTVTQTGDVRIESLAGTPATTVPNLGDGVVVADASGTLFKRDLTSILRLPQHHLYVGDSSGVAAPFAPGADSTFLGIFNGAPTWFSLSSLLSEKAWIQGGNTNPISTVFGNMTPGGEVDMRANGQTQMRLNGATNAVDVVTDLNLDGDSTRLLADGQPGAMGNPLVSQGPSLTPRWSTGMVITDTNVTITANTFDVNSTTTNLNSATTNVTSAVTNFNDYVLFRDSVRFDLLPDMPLNYGHLLVGDSNDRAVPLPPGINESIFLIRNGRPTWVRSEEASYWSLSGNAGIPASAYLGTTDANDLRLATNGQLRLTVTQTGDVRIESLAGTPATTVPNLGDGVVVADASGTLFKRDLTSILRLPQHHLYVGDSSGVAAPFAPGADSTFLGIFNGAPTWFSLSSLLSEKAWIQGGNTNPISTVFGNMTPGGEVDMRANGQTQMRLNGATNAVDVVTDLNLDGDSTRLLADGQPGAMGNPLVSQGPSLTPRWSTGMVITDTNVTITANTFDVNSTTTNLNSATTNVTSAVTNFNDYVLFRDSVRFDLLPDMPLNYGHLLVGDSNDRAVPLPPGINESIFLIRNGTPTWVRPEEASYWSLSGNAGVPASAYLGTTDANDLRIATNGQLRMTVTQTGDVRIESLSGAPANIAPNLGDGVVIADASGSLFKRDLTSILQLPQYHLYMGDSNNVAAPFAPGADSTFLGIFNGQPTWYDLGDLLSKKAWIVGGNTDPDSPIFGNLATTGVVDLNIYAGGQARINIAGATGNINVPGLAGTAAPAPIAAGDGFVIADIGGTLVKRDVNDLFANIPLQQNHIFVGNASNVAAQVPPGADSTILAVIGGTPTWTDIDDLLDSRAWLVGGNTAPPSPIIGNRATTGVVDLNIYAGGQARINIAGATGNINVPGLAGTAAPAPIAAGDGFVIADIGGTLVKRDVNDLFANIPLQQNHIFVGNASNVAAQVPPGADSTILAVIGGTPTWTDIDDLLDSRAWLVGGNTAPPSPIIGNRATTGVVDLNIYAGGQARINIAGATGNINVPGLAGTAAPAPIAAGDGFVIADIGGTLVKRDVNDLFANIPLQQNHIFVGNASNVAAQVPPGADSTILAVIGGTPTWTDIDDLLDSRAWLVGGNTAPPSPIIGNRATTGVVDLNIYAGGQARINIAGATGNINVPGLAGTAAPAPIAAGDGFVIADIGGTLVKRDVNDLFANIPLQQNHIFVGNASNVAAQVPPGADSTILAVIGGTPTWTDIDDLLDSRAWLVGGNTAPPSPIIGNRATTGVVDLNIYAGGQARINIAGATGNINVPGLAGTAAPAPIAAGDGFVIADIGGTLVKRDVNDLFANIPLQQNHIFVGNASNVAAQVPPGADSTILAVIGGTPTWTDIDDLLDSRAWLVGGNTAPPSPIIGNRATTGVVDLNIYAGGQARINIAGATGNINVPGLAGTAAPAPIAAGDGFVIADIGGTLVKRDVNDLFANIPLQQNHIFVGNASNVAAQVPPGADSTILAVIGGTPTWTDIDDLLDSRAWLVGGNTAPPSPIIGNRATTGVVDLNIYAGGQARINIAGATGNINVPGLAGTAAPAPIAAGDGFVIADIGGTLVKRDVNDLFANIPLQQNHIFVGNASNVAAQVPPGADSTILAVIGGTPTWTDIDDLLDSRAWLVGGNTAPPSPIIGNRATTGVVDLNIYAGGQARINIAGATGNINVPGLAGTAAPAPIAAGDGFVIADIGGTLVKRDVNDLFANIPLQQNHIFVGNASNVAAQVPPGADSTILAVIGGTPTWTDIDDLLDSRAWLVGGNTAPPSPIIGNRATTGVVDLNIYAGGQARINIAGATGNINVPGLAGTAAPAPIAAGDGFVIADIGGTLVKRDVNDLFANIPLQQNHIFVGNASNVAAQVPPGADSTILAVIGGTPTWTDIDDLLDSRAWLVGGNTAPPSPIIGNRATTGVVDLNIYAGGQARINIAGATGNINVPGLAGTAAPAPIAAGDGFVIADIGGTLVKRDVNDLFANIPLQQNHIFVGNASNVAAQVPPGPEGSLLQIESGTPTWISPQDANFWSLQGNTGVGATAYLGTTDNNDLRLATDATVRVTINTTGQVTVNDLSGVPPTTPLTANDGFVIADAAGTIAKRDRSAILAALGIFGGRYTNASAATEYTVVITLPVGATLDAQASITITPEATTSVSITPFIVSGSRTATSFTINFPGGLNPGESINWLVRNP